MLNVSFLRISISSLLLFISPFLLLSQNKVEEIENLVNYCHEKGILNGTLLVAEKGEIIYHKSLGLADFDNNIPLTENTPLCLASITKQFTAMGIMILEHQGKIEYSDSLKKLFPEFPTYMHDITVRQLLQHTSGLKRTHYEYSDSLINDNIYENIKKSVDDKLLFTPNSDLRYSNSAFVISAMIIEKVSGETYESFLKQHIFDPLGMTRTFVYKAEDQKRKDIAIAFDGFGNKDDYNIFTYGSAGIYSTPEDLFRWCQSFTTDKIIPSSSKKEAFEPAVSNDGKLLEYKIRNNTWSYGLGLAIYRDSLEGVVGHSGAYGGFFNLLMKDMKNDTEVILLTNNGRLLPLFDFGYAIQDILRNKPYTLPKTSIDLAIREKCFDDLDKGIEYYHHLKKNDPNKYNFGNEHELNRLGYAFLQKERFDDAITIFKLLISEFPKAYNPYDSLGEGYYMNKQYKLSIKFYKKSLALNPENSNAEKMISKIKAEMKK